MSAAIVCVLAAIGYLPTRRLAGADGPAAMLAGCLISLAGAAAAGGLIVAAPASTPDARMKRAFLAMFVRLAVALVLGVAAALSGALARMPLLFWLATTYVVLLPGEVHLAIRSE